MHDMGDWKPERMVPVRANGRERSLYLWIVPRR
jgi:hypothetical protein